jgi:hypothetical protein
VTDAFFGNPFPGTALPNLAGFREAQDRKRTLIGSVVTFFWEPVVVYGSEVPCSPESGAPLDPTASAMASTQASAQVTASVFFKAINRGGAAGSEVAEPIGRDQKSRIFMNVASGDAYELDLAGAMTGSAATELEFHGSRFQVYSMKWDEIVQGYRRFLVYAANEGNDR